MSQLASTQQYRLIGKKDPPHLLEHRLPPELMSGFRATVSGWPAVGDSTGLLQGSPERLTQLAKSFERMRSTVLVKVRRITPSTGWINEPETEMPIGLLVAFDMNDSERMDLLRATISSQAIEGVHIPFDVASHLLDQVLREPLIDIG